MSNQFNQFGLLLLAIIAFNGCDYQHRSLPPERAKPQKTSDSKKSEPMPTFSQKLVEERQQLANNLTVTQNLQNKYQALKKQVGVKSGKNKNTIFVGIQGMKDALRNQPVGI